MTLIFDVPGLNAMRLADSIPRWTRMCDVRHFPLMQCYNDDVGIVVNDGLIEDEMFADDDTKDGQVDG